MEWMADFGQKEEEEREGRKEGRKEGRFARSVDGLRVRRSQLPPLYYTTQENGRKE